MAWRFFYALSTSPISCNLVALAIGELGCRPNSEVALHIPIKWGSGKKRPEKQFYYIALYWLSTLHCLQRMLTQDCWRKIETIKLLVPTSTGNEENVLIKRSLVETSFHRQKVPDRLWTRQKDHERNLLNTLNSCNSRSLGSFRVFCNALRGSI